MKLHKARCFFSPAFPAMAAYRGFAVLVGVASLLSAVRCDVNCKGTDGHPGEAGSTGRDGLPGIKGQKGEPDDKWMSDLQTTPFSCWCPLLTQYWKTLLQSGSSFSFLCDQNGHQISIFQPGLLLLASNMTKQSHFCRFYKMVFQKRAPSPSLYINHLSVTIL
ncbi:hypothetical protein XENOCAPTIV_025330 [Xenoophorus captivus]|uniref:Uncharacterized protein n=1 Tax=Xenoophorus captivus TaxID=1517983 RepID=A0ABV0QWJ2_9TELE